VAHRERMSPADAAWLHMDRPTNLMVVNAVIWFDAPVDWELVRKIFQTRMVGRYPRFQQRVVDTGVAVAPVGAPQWEDDHTFDIGNHLHHRALYAPGDQHALQELVADLMATPIDLTKPLWHAYFIDGYGDGCAIMLRVHHCIADGIALAQVFLSLTDGAPEVSRGTEVAVRTRGPLAAITGPAGALAGVVGGVVANARGTAATVVAEGRKVLAEPNRLVDLVSAGRADAAVLAKLVLMPQDSNNVLRGTPGIAKRVVWSAPMPLNAVKAAGRTDRATVNDVLLTALTGALRRYLESKDGLVEEVRAVVPYNLRATGAPLPRTLGNRFGLVFLGLPVGAAERDDRLAGIKTRMDEIKDSPEGAIGFGLLTTIGSTPSQVEKAVIDLFSSKATMVVTNVPGPTSQVYLAGAPVAGVIPWVPSSGDIGIGISIFSYAGQVFVGLAADAGLLPDPELVVAAFEEEVATLLATAG
jgi:diacylglycerol O-acyltransferase